MPLYLYENKLLTVSGALAANENCCCEQCRCCQEGTYPSGFKFTVLGITNNAACDPFNDCTNLNGDYYTDAFTEANCVNTGSQCSLDGAAGIVDNACGWGVAWGWQVVHTIAPTKTRRIVFWLDVFDFGLRWKHEETADAPLDCMGTVNLNLTPEFSITPTFCNWGGVVVSVTSVP